MVREPSGHGWGETLNMSAIKSGHFLPCTPTRLYLGDRYMCGTSGLICHPVGRVKMLKQNQLFYTSCPSSVLVAVHILVSVLTICSASQYQ